MYLGYLTDAGEAADDKVEETGELEFDLDGLGKVKSDVMLYNSKRYDMATLNNILFMLPTS